MSRILKLDSHGQPSCWLSQQEAVMYHAKNMVSWQLGEGEGDVTYRGGDNRVTGLQSIISTAPIIAVRGEAAASKRANKPPSLTNPALFRRDRHICAYCGKHFSEQRLTRDHVVPRNPRDPHAKKGPDIWTNVVTACEACNHHKDNMSLEEARMTLLYVPYAPNLAEALILEGRNILACQMSYLATFLPKHSRVWDDPKMQAIH